MSSQTKHMYAIELTTDQVFEISELHVQLREQGILPSNSNLGMFMHSALYRGLAEFRKKLDEKLSS